LATFPPTLLAVALLVFAIFKFVPGDPARLLAGPDATDQDIAIIRHEMGLDQPLYVQLGLYVWHTVTVDLGVSNRTHQPVVAEVASRLPVSAELAVTALLVAIVVGASAGVMAAAKPDSAWELLGTAGSLIGICVPNFWLGLALVLLFAV
jgi:ABC-type dipeptide/oligopeptide/nickel transport system permease component